MFLNPPGSFGAYLVVQSLVGVAEAPRMAGHDNSGSDKSSEAMDLPIFNAENLQNNMKIIYYWSLLGALTSLIFVSCFVLSRSYALKSLVLVAAPHACLAVMLLNVILASYPFY